MLSQLRLLRVLSLLLLSGSVFSTLPPSPSSSVYHWKSLPRPQIYGSEERHSASVDDLVKREPDSGTSGPPYAPEPGPVRPMDGDAQGKGEGRAGQLELRAGTEPGLGKAGKSRGLRVDDGVKRWGENVKRKWGQNRMGVWGKRESADRERRRWGENSMRVWGKRTPFPDGGNEKRKWGENTMGVWGKRSPEEKEKKTEEEEVVQAEIAPSGSTPEVTGSSEGQTGSSSSNARRRRKRGVFEWYNDDDDLDFVRDLGRDLSKRSQARRRSYPRPYGGPKRNWETNTMRVWGKRNYPNPWEEEEREDYYEAEPIRGNKRKWTSDNAIRIWG